MKLYYTPGVCSLAPHIVLREAELNFTLERVDPQTKQTERGTDFRTINPNAYVPALEIDKGVILTEGPAIMQFIADQAPNARLMPPANSMDRYRLLSWLNFITSEIHKGFSPLFKPGMPAEAKTLVKEQLATHFRYVERHLSTQDYLVGNGFTIADAYLFVTTGWAGFVDVNLEAYASIQKFRDRIGSRPAVQAALRAEGLLK